LKICAFLFGIGLGGDYMIIPLMAAELYGVAILGRVMGIVLTADSVSESLVPMLVASMRDVTGSYASGFLVLIVLAAIGAVAVACLPKAGEARAPVSVR
jgi:MFS-type transporter involved in bile tolerance (Atg22 family)